MFAPTQGQSSEDIGGSVTVSVDSGGNISHSAAVQQLVSNPAYRPSRWSARIGREQGTTDSAASELRDVFWNAPRSRGFVSRICFQVSRDAGKLGVVVGQYAIENPQRRAKAMERSRALFSGDGSAKHLDQAFSTCHERGSAAQSRFTCTESFIRMLPSQLPVHS
jgi:hypothetical protein